MELLPGKHTLSVTYFEIRRLPGRAQALVSSQDTKQVSFEAAPGGFYTVTATGDGTLGEDAWKVKVETTGDPEEPMLE